MIDVDKILNGSIKFDSLKQSFVTALKREMRKHERDIAKGKDGNCAAIAYNLAAILDATLVHAMLGDKPPYKFHAWVEIDGMILDLTQVGSARYVKRSELPYPIHASHAYRGREMHLLVGQGTFGPWDDEWNAMIDGQK